MAKKIVGEDGKVYYERKPIYKRWWFILLVILIILGIIGSRGSKNENSSSGTKTAESKKEEVKTFKIGDMVNTKNIELTVNDISSAKKVTDDSGYLEYKPDGDDNRFIILHVTIKNIAKEMISLDSSSFQLYSGDVQYSPTMIIVKDGLNLDGINPGVQIKRRIFFDVPKDVADAKNLKLKLGSSIFSQTGGHLEIDLSK